jgi:catechol 2,3-dioxygenase-like lactoylglutathione lyase family enzyme
MSRLHHVALGAQDVAALATFYREVFELPELTRHHHDDGSLRSVWLDLGGSVLMVEPSGEPPRRVEGVGAGPFLLALSTTPAQRLAAESRLEQAGCAIEARSDYSSYARDPEGNRIAISHYPERANES